VPADLLAPDSLLLDENCDPDERVGETGARGYDGEYYDSERDQDHATGMAVNDEDMAVESVDKLEDNL
jgi:hypothetical protein